MATSFQENLTQQSAPSVGSFPRALTPPSSGASTIAGINAVTNLVTQGVAIFDQIGDEAATTDASNKALNLIEQHDQGLIDDITFRRMKKELSIQLRRDNPGREGEVIAGLTASFGADPVARQENTEATILENFIVKGTGIIGTGKTDAEKAEAGENATKAEHTAMISLATANRVAADTKILDAEKVRTSERFVADLTNTLFPLTQSLIDSGRHVKTEADKISWFTNIHQRVQALKAEFRVTAQSGINGFTGPAHEAGMRRIKIFENSLDSLVSSKENSMNSVMAKLNLLKTLNADTELEFRDSVPFVNRISKFFGPKTMSILFAEGVTTEVKSALKSEVQALWEKGVRGDAAAEKKAEIGQSLLNIMKAHEKPYGDISKLSNEEKTQLVKSSSNLLNTITLDNTATDQDYDSFARQSLFLLNTLDANVNTAVNQDNALKIYTRPSYIAKLKALEAHSPEKAQVIGQSIQRFAAKSIETALRNDSNLKIKIDKATGMPSADFTKVLPVVIQQARFDVRKKLKERALREGRDEAGIKMIERAFESLIAHKRHSPDFAKLTDSEGLNAIVFSIEKAIGRDSILAEGSKYAVDFKLEGEKARAARTITKPTLAEKRASMIKSTYEAGEEALIETIKRSRTAMRRKGKALQKARWNAKLKKLEMINLTAEDEWVEGLDD